MPNPRRNQEETIPVLDIPESIPPPIIESHAIIEPEENLVSQDEIDMIEANRQAQLALFQQGKNQGVLET